MDRFIEARRANLDGSRRNPYFKDLIGSINAAYKVAIRSVPSEGYPTTFGRILLICHKSLLSAAMLILERQPEDSVAITRRAVEAAKTALAIKLDGENAERWTAFQERHERWLARQKGEKPKHFKVQLKAVRGDPLIDTMDLFLGVLSDASVHFTPEFYDSLDWQWKTLGEGKGEVHLNYFHTNDREIERQFITLGAVHGRILDAFDRCFDGRFRQDPVVLPAMQQLFVVGKRLNDQYQQKYGVPSGIETITDEAPQSESPEPE